jgi:hypothetical protein
MIAEGVLAVEYGASAEDVARTTHAHVRAQSDLLHFLCRLLLFSSFTFSPHCRKLSRRLLWLLTENPFTCNFTVLFNDYDLDNRFPIRISIKQVLEDKLLPFQILSIIFML